MSQKRALHPFFFGVFPVLYLVRVNLWSITFGEMLPSLFITLGILAVLYVIGRRTWGDGRRAAVCLSVWTLLFFSYGHVWAEVNGRELSGFVVGRDAVLLPIWIVLAVLGVLAGLRVKALGSVTGLFNVVSVFLVLTTAAPVAIHFAAFRPAEAMPAEVSAGLAPRRAAETTSRPDIYYLVFDRYAGPQTLRDQFNFSNDRFLRFLEREGFAVPCSSFANYENTTKSLAASLNLDYVDWISDRVGRTSRSLVPFYSAIRNSAVKRFLRASGYRVVHIGSWWDPTNSDPEADMDFRLDAPSGFTRALYTSSALWPAARRGVVGSVQIGREELHRSVALRQLELLRQAPSFRGPKFVFAHVLMPHPPYVFEADGSLQTHEGRKELVRAGGSPYVEQLKYLNARLERVIRGLLTANTKRPPVVIIQGDEGPLLTDIGYRRDIDAQHATSTQLRIKYHIMTAFHLPGVRAKSIPDSVSPVNVFRMVFNTYFGSSLDMLPDRAYISNPTRPYQMNNVTSRVRRSLERVSSEVESTGRGSCTLSRHVTSERPAEKSDVL